MKTSEIIPILENGIYKESWLGELNNLPQDIKELEKNLAALMKVDKANLSIQQIHNLFHTHAILFVNHFELIESKIINSSQIWRARKDVNEDSEDLSNPQTFSYPPTCNLNGRGHLKEHPVFYGALNKATALFETKPKVRDFLFIGEWNSRCTRDVKTRFLLPRNIPDSSPLKGLSEKQTQQFIEMAQLYGREKAPQLELISRFIGECFLEEKPPYHLTSWLGHRILFDNNNLDLFYYASSLNSKGSLNVAIKPTFVDSFLHVSKVYKIQIESIKGTSIDFIPIKVADNINEKLVWRMLDEADMQYLHNKRSHKPNP